MSAKSTTLTDLLKNTPLLALEGAQTVQQALHMMDVNGRSAVGVIAASGAGFAGIFTDDDFLRRVVIKGLNPKTTMLSEVMTATPVTAPAGWTVQEAFDLMSLHTFGHLPVLCKDGRLLGILSQSDLRANIARKLKEAAKELGLLRSYAYGSYGAGAHY